MSSPAVAPVRRHLGPRQADTVGRLVDAAVALVSRTGYDGLTVRGVAQRAKVAPATAYTYFASKEHLLAEVYWRRIQTLPPVRADRRRSTVDRVADATRDIALLVGDEPELAAAVTTALLAHDADVKRLRDLMGQAFAERLRDALDRDATPDLLRTLVLTLTGALLVAGMGNVAYRDLPGEMAAATALMIGARKRSR
jgi:AcrR family transcriptional regulator